MTRARYWSRFACVSDEREYYAWRCTETTEPLGLEARVTANNVSKICTYSKWTLQYKVEIVLTATSWLAGITSFSVLVRLQRQQAILMMPLTTTTRSRSSLFPPSSLLRSLPYMSWHQYGLGSHLPSGFRVSFHAILTLWYKAVSFYFIAGEVGKPGSSVSVPGTPGQKGDRGAVGRTGAQGAKGERGQTGKSGVKYVRWGRTTCPSGAEIVYKGTWSDQLTNRLF